MAYTPEETAALATIGAMRQIADHLLSVMKDTAALSVGELAQVAGIIQTSALNGARKRIHSDKNKVRALADKLGVAAPDLAAAAKSSQRDAPQAVTPAAPIIVPTSAGYPGAAPPMTGCATAAPPAAATVASQLPRVGPPNDPQQPDPILPICLLPDGRAGVRRTVWVCENYGGTDNRIRPVDYCDDGSGTIPGVPAPGAITWALYPTQYAAEQGCTGVTNPNPPDPPPLPSGCFNGPDGLAPPIPAGAKWVYHCSDDQTCYWYNGTVQEAGTNRTYGIASFEPITPSTPVPGGWILAGGGPVASCMPNPPPPPPPPPINPPPPPPPPPECPPCDVLPPPPPPPPPPPCCPPVQCPPPVVKVAAPTVQVFINDVLQTPTVNVVVSEPPPVIDVAVSQSQSQAQSQALIVRPAIGVSPGGAPADEQPVHWDQPGSFLFGSNAQRYRDSLWGFLGINSVVGTATLDDLLDLQRTLIADLANDTGEPAESSPGVL